MKRVFRHAMRMLIVLNLGGAIAAHAAVPVVFGTSWDGPGAGLQTIIDAYYGGGKISASQDYIGAKLVDLDPWFWVGNDFSALLVREIAGNSNRNLVGWYEETGTKPVIDGVNDGVVFTGPQGEGAVSFVVFNKPMTKFGFYMNPNGTLGAMNAPEPEKFFTNRFYNDLGPTGAGALHVPFDGDVQALVYDISSYTQPNTWLVCFEDVDSGANPGPPGSAQTDNDFNDFVFEVTALGATPTKALSIGALKARYK